MADLSWDINEAGAIVLHNVPSQDPYDSEQEMAVSLNYWIGNRFMKSTGRNPRDLGHPYWSFDIRRAVAYLRVSNLIGAGIGACSADIRERIRQAASHESSGWVVAGGTPHNDSELIVNWIPDKGIFEFTADILDRGWPFLAVPCHVNLLGSSPRQETTGDPR